MSWIWDSNWMSTAFGSSYPVIWLARLVLLAKACDIFQKRLQCFCQPSVTVIQARITNVKWITLCFTCLQQRSTSPWTVSCTSQVIRICVHYSRIYFQIINNSSHWVVSVPFRLIISWKLCHRIQNFLNDRRRGRSIFRNLLRNPTVIPPIYPYRHFLPTKMWTAFHFCNPTLPSLKAFWFTLSGLILLYRCFDYR